MEAVLKALDLNTLDVVMIPIWAFLFIVFWKFSEKYFFASLLKLMALRESQTEGALLEAKEKSEKAATLMANYEEKLGSQRAEFMKARMAKIHLIKKDVANKTEEAEKAAAKKIAAEREKTKAYLAAASKRIEEESQSLAELLVSKLRKGNA